MQSLRNRPNRLRKADACSGLEKSERTTMSFTQPLGAPEGGDSYSPSHQTPDLPAPPDYDDDVVEEERLESTREAEAESAAESDAESDDDSA